MIRTLCAWMTAHEKEALSTRLSAIIIFLDRIGFRVELCVRSDRVLSSLNLGSLIHMNSGARYSGTRPISTGSQLPARLLSQTGRAKAERSGA